MDVQVKAWVPPTKEHEELKIFMLEQIEISKNDLNFYNNMLKLKNNKSELEYFEEKYKNLLSDLKYYKEKDERETILAKKRTEYIKLLKESI
jgi:hypothetical protein